MELPSDPADLQLLLHALVDGELDAATTLALERRLVDDPALAAEHARIAALQTAVRNLPRPGVSDAFQARIAALGVAPQAAARPASAHSAWLGWRAMAASILVTAVLTSGLTQWAMTRNAPDSFAAAVASSHRRSLLAASPVDVASSDRHTVKPWLDARIGLSPAAPDLAKDGFSLLGGRVEVITDKPVPALVYKHREHLITLVAAPQDGRTASIPAGAERAAGGFSLIRWADGAFTYWAISDTDRATLEDFVNRFREAAAAG
ncbi:anti-sigma factor family protein [Bosea spartocytisi]|nr:anti-sigma factor [Bosea spartocytisi]MCT4470875.1 anti-sigma factor [Bosea spartocytisi]